MTAFITSSVSRLEDKMQEIEMKQEIFFQVFVVDTLNNLVAGNSVSCSHSAER